MVGRTERLREQLGEDLEQLVAACLGTRGSESDREAAWERLLEAVRRMAIDLGRGTYHLGLEDAEDVAQMVQLRVLERLPQLRHAAAFPLWVRRVIHHAVLDFLRNRRPLLSLDAMLDSESPSHGEFAEDGLEPAPTDPYDRVLMRMDLDRALSRLPDLYREPIRLHVLQGLPQDEVGRRLGRPRSTVATQIERGLHRLRRSLAGVAPASA